MLLDFEQRSKEKGGNSRREGNGRRLYRPEGPVSVLPREEETKRDSLSLSLVLGEGRTRIRLEETGDSGILCACVCEEFGRKEIWRQMAR